MADIEAPDNDTNAAPKGSWDDTGGMPREKAVRIAQIGLVVLALIVVAIVLISKGGGDDAKDASNGDKTKTTTADGKPAPTGKADWPVTLRGRPPALGKTKDPATDVKAGGPAGIYLWSDFDGWHLWVVGGGNVPKSLSGTLTSSDNLDKAVLAVPDTGTVTKSGKTATFTLPTDKPISGLDFNPGFFAKQISVTLQGPDGPVDAKLIKIGSKGAPAPTPLVISKSVP